MPVTPCFDERFHRLGARIVDNRSGGQNESPVRGDVVEQLLRSILNDFTRGP